MKVTLNFPKTALLLAALFAALSLTNCNLVTPDDPGRTNPLDGDNPDTHGDPYHLTAELADGGIRLVWHKVDFPPLIGYSIYRRTDDSLFTRIQQVPAADTTFTDRTIQNGHRYEYYVVVRTNSGEGEASAVAKVAVNTEPVLFIEGETVTETPTRNVTLTILAFGAEQMLISNNSDFAGAIWEPYSTTKAWQLTTGEGTKRVYGRIAFAGDTTGAVSDEIEPAALNLTVEIANGAAETPTKHVPVRINAPGATHYKISNEPFEDQPPLIWEPYADSVQWTLWEGIGTKTVYVEVKNDFDIKAVASDQVEPAGIRPSLQILPDSAFINHTDITLSMPNTGALEMKIADNSDSSLVNWQPYRPQINWNLSNEDGWKRIYAWFSNEFYSVGPVVDSVGLDTRAEIASFEWSAMGGDTLVPGDVVRFTMRTANDAFGVENDGTALVTVERWESIELAGQADGSYTGQYEIMEQTPEVSNVRVTVSFSDRNGNVARPITSNARLTARWTPSAGEERDFPLGNTGSMIRMVWIPAGNFQMGRQPGEQDSYAYEDPRHIVIFTKGFWMGKYEVTQLQWTTVMGSNPSRDYGVGDNYPVYSISWDDIQAFEENLNNSFRLPSESEWEYACRAGTNSRFYWGDDPDYNGIEAYAWHWEDHMGVTSHPVGEKRGIYLIYQETFGNGARMLGITIIQVLQMMVVHGLLLQINIVYFGEAPMEMKFGNVVPPSVFGIPMTLGGIILASAWFVMLTEFQNVEVYIKTSERLIPALPARQ